VIVRQVDLAPVALHLSEVHRILGESWSPTRSSAFSALGFELMPERGGDPDFTVHIPSWRLDVEREIDVVEEIARLHGYDNSPTLFPRMQEPWLSRPMPKKTASCARRCWRLG